MNVINSTLHCPLFWNQKKWENSCSCDGKRYSLSRNCSPSGFVCCADLFWSDLIWSQDTKREYRQTLQTLDIDWTRDPSYSILMISRTWATNWCGIFTVHCWWNWYDMIWYDRYVDSKLMRSWTEASKWRNTNWRRSTSLTPAASASASQNTLT